MLLHAGKLLMMHCLLPQQQQQQLAARAASSPYLPAKVSIASPGTQLRTTHGRAIAARVSPCLGVVGELVTHPAQMLTQELGDTHVRQPDHQQAATNEAESDYCLYDVDVRLRP